MLSFWSSLDRGLCLRPFPPSDVLTAFRAVEVVITAPMKEQVNCQVAPPLERGHHSQQLDYLARSPALLAKRFGRKEQGRLSGLLIGGSEVVWHGRRATRERCTAC